MSVFDWCKSTGKLWTNESCEIFGQILERTWWSEESKNGMPVQTVSHLHSLAK